MTAPPPFTSCHKASRPLYMISSLSSFKFFIHKGMTQVWTLSPTLSFRLLVLKLEVMPSGLLLLVLNHDGIIDGPNFFPQMENFY